MILAHKTIALLGQPLFTLIDLNTPMDEELPIPSVACFTYFVNGDDQLLSSQHHVAANSQHAVLTLCGMTLGKMLTGQTGRIHSIILHFHL